MTISRTWSICGLGAALLIAGCDEGGGGGGGDGSASTMDGATAGMDGAAGSTDGGGTPLDGMALTEAGTPAPVMCQAHLYQCGDGVDNDGDGLIDWQDPDCLGPCDNNEGGFYLNIPGGDAQPCALECYFDQDEGVGNDGCQWDHRCDPLEPDQNALCRYMPPPRRPGITCPDTQTEMCARVCGPLVPNGCDCFGCCNLPAGGDRWVFIGSVDGAGNPTCDLASVNDDAACHPCTPVPGCLNECGRCELCLGRSTLPADCYPPPEPDGGYTPPPETCSDPSRQSCGLPEHPPCPDGQYCLTGCCTFFG